MSAFLVYWPVAWIAETLAASTLLMAAVFILRRPAARLFGAHAAYCLWVIPALRLVLPPVPGAVILPVAPVGGRALAASPSVDLFSPSELAASALQRSVALAPDFDWGATLLCVWLAGAVLHMAWHVVSYRHFLSRAVGLAEPAHRLDGILVHNADVAGPAAAGVLHRRILVPYDFIDRFAPRERRLALAHEAAHHRRGDLIANWAALLFLSLHWFNPLAHAAYRAFRADQELACDATVLRAASEVERHAYASAVVKAAWARSPVAACPMNSARHLKARLSMMKGGVVQRPVAGLLTVAAVAVAALGVTASRTAADLPGPAFASLNTLVMERVIAERAAPNLTEREAVADVPATQAAATEKVVATPVASSADNRPTALAPLLPLIVVEDQPGPVLVNLADASAHEALKSVAEVLTAKPVSANDNRVRPQPIATSAVLPAMPAVDDLKALAAMTRGQISSLSQGVIAVRDARAVMVDGAMNAADPGTAFVGFCGYVLLSGQTEWTAFFASTTASKPGRRQKCAGPQSTEDYSRYLQPQQARISANRRSSRSRCGADQASCSTPFRLQLSQYASPNAMSFTMVNSSYP